MPYKIRPRAGTAAEWTAADPVLAEREIGFERDESGKLRMKMGDGETGWNDLPFGLDQDLSDSRIDELIAFCDNGVMYEELSDLSWSMGYFNTDSGTFSSSTRTTYTTDILRFDHDVLFTSDDFSTYEISLLVYDQDDDDLFYGKWFTTHPIPIPAGYRFRVQMRARTAGTMNPVIYDHCALYRLHYHLDYLLVRGVSHANGLIVADDNGRNWGMMEPVKLVEDSHVGLRDYGTYKYTLQVFESYSAYASPYATYYSQQADVIVPAGRYVRIIVDRADLSTSITEEDARGQIMIVPNEFYDFKNLMKEEFEGIRYDISAVRNRLIALTNTIPVWYQTYIQTKAAAINESRDALDSGTQFIFITDVHVNAYNQRMHSKALLNYLCENTLIKEVFNGGDVANGRYNPHLGKVDFSKAVRKGVEYCRPDSYARTFFVAGNHDLGVDYDGQGETYGAIISREELYDISGIKENVNVITQDPDTPFNYTYRDDTNKIYYVIATANLRDTVTGEIYKKMYKWFCHALNSCPAEYTIVVFNHEIFRSSTDDRFLEFIGNICDVIDAYNSRGSSPEYATDPTTVIDFSNGAGEVACMIGGHAHMDMSKTTDGGVPVIVTTTDNAGAEASASTLTRTAGTVSEQAFDVFTIDTTNRTIEATRIGAGEDRSFTY